MASAAAFPGSAGEAADGGAFDWSNETNIGANDGSYASTAAFTTGNSYTIYGSNFGFALPVNAVVTGIKATVERFAAGVAGSPSIKDVYIQLTKTAGTRTGNNKAAATEWVGADFAAVDYGADGDLWGLTWSRAEINDSGFGLAIQCYELGTGTAQPRIDYVQLTVYYQITRTRGLLGVGF